MIRFDYNAYWRTDEVNEFIKVLSKELQNSGINDVGVTNGEPSNWTRFYNWGYAEALFDDKQALSDLALLTTHGFINGDYDKLSMSGILFKEEFGKNLEEVKQEVIYTGDSPNDGPMFACFPNSVGVANVRQFEGKMANLPAWVTEKEGGWGFAEMVNILLAGEA